MNAYRQLIAMALAVIVRLSCVAGDALAYTVYVSNEKGNSITVIDSDTLEVRETIRVGQRPRGIMLTKEPESGEVDAGRHGALGRHHLAKLSRA